ncbi:reverse transcriptase domain, reverse transcriptase zinc-binding domain protein [Tanacetum coccineum]|uniref:Reverse transcriptase domain, reverse transcriptase zinc-binding domain protein n=1 Tax=Tanacetum coccineum TaxID=301880 RepID=A0ABQ4ZP53_9ASTR
MAGCRGRWVEGVWEWVWDWVRPPRGRAVEDLDNLNELLGDVSFSQDRVDRWDWKLGTNGVFSVRSLACWIEEWRVSSMVGVNKTRWNNIVPRKINVFVWRALLGRLPVRVELDKKCIDLDSLLCPNCEHVVESVFFASLPVVARLGFVVVTVVGFDNIMVGFVKDVEIVFEVVGVGSIVLVSYSTSYFWYQTRDIVRTRFNVEMKVLLDLKKMMSLDFEASTGMN